jgi:hypothetical protein
MRKVNFDMRMIVRDDARPKAAGEHKRRACLHNGLCISAVPGWDGQVGRRAGLESGIGGATFDGGKYTVEPPIGAGWCAGLKPGSTVAPATGCAAS